MKRKFNKVISFTLVLCFAFSIGITTGAAKTNEIKGHWAEETLNEWIKLDLLRGDSNGKYNPNDDITRAEFMTLVNRMMNYTEKSKDIKKYIDVSPEKWYYDDCAKALAAGYINGTSANTLSPEETITREQAITIITRIKGLAQTTNTNILSQVSDSSEISSWAKTPIAIAINEGLVTGSNGKINPSANATRCEAIVLLDRSRTDTRMYYFAGTYGPETGTITANNVIIASSGIKLRNFTVNGDLQIAKSVGDGEATLDNVIIHGDLLVNGGGRNSLYFSNVTVDGTISVHKDDANTVRIIVSGNSMVNAVILNSSSILITQELSDGGINQVTIPADFIGSNPVELIGEFEAVTNEQPNANIILSGASINTLNLNASATITADEDSNISTANIAQNAGEGTIISIIPEIIKGDGAQYASIKGVAITPTPTTKPTSTGGSSKSSGDSKDEDDDDDEPVVRKDNIESINTVTASVYHREEYVLPEKVTVNLSGNKTAELVVTWTPDTVSTDECGEYLFEGTVSLTSNIRNPKNLKAKLILFVEPILEEISISKQPDKLNYYVGEDLDLTGLVVEGSYSDGSKIKQTISFGNVSGFDSSKIGEQTIIVTVGEKTTTFKVKVYNKVDGILVKLNTALLPKTIDNVSNGAEKSASGLGLPTTVTASVYEVETFFNIEWNIDDSEYDPSKKTEQKFTVYGEVILPETVTNPNEIPLKVEIDITVEAAKYLISFDLKGLSETNIPSQSIKHGEKVIEPEEEPTSISHNFMGWYTNADYVGEVFDFDTNIVTGDLTLFASWSIKEYNVTFNNNYENAPSPTIQKVEHGTTVEELSSEPTRDGFILAGWYTDVECTQVYDFETEVTKEITLYAKWMDTLDLVLEALTFNTIANGNTSEDTIVYALDLPNGLDEYPNVQISWSSDNKNVISDYGYVTRPESDGNNVTVNLVATVRDDTRFKTKEFTLIVLKMGKFTLSNVDEYFAEGYPKAKIENQRVIVTIKLIKPAEVYMTGINWGEYESTVDGVLHGHTNFRIDGDEKYEVNDSPEYVGYRNITDTNEVVIETNMYYYAGEDITINFIIRDDDYMSKEVTKLFMAADTAPAEYNYGPYFYYAYLNDNADKIYLWSMDLLDTDSAPEPSAFSLSRNYNYDESCGTVTGVKLHNNEEKKISWIELSVTDIKSEDKEHLYVSYEKQEGKLTDLDGNECQWISNNVWETSVDIKSVLLYQGDSSHSKLYITLADNVNDWWHPLGKDNFVITNNGKPVSIIGIHYESYRRPEGTIGFICDKIDSTGDLEIKFNPSENIEDWAFDDLQEIKYDGEIIILPTFNQKDIAAQYDGTDHKLIITFAENYYLRRFYGPTCGFSIKLDEKDYIIRSSINNREDNVITISLGEDIPDLTGEDITLTYSPTCEEMYDITSREIPPFGPIDVETEPPPHVVG